MSQSHKTNKAIRGHNKPLDCLRVIRRTRVFRCHNKPLDCLRVIRRTRLFRRHNKPLDCLRVIRRTKLLGVIINPWITTELFIIILYCRYIKWIPTKILFQQYTVYQYDETKQYKSIYDKLNNIPTYLFVKKMEGDKTNLGVSHLRWTVTFQCFIYTTNKPMRPNVNIRSNSSGLLRRTVTFQCFIYTTNKPIRPNVNIRSNISGLLRRTVTFQWFIFTTGKRISTNVNIRSNSSGLLRRTVTFQCFIFITGEPIRPNVNIRSNSSGLHQQRMDKLVHTNV